jgi:O-antigen ligase
MALRVPPPSTTLGLERPEDLAAGLTGSTDSYRLSRALIIVLLATTVDVPNFLDRGNSVRYALLLVPFLSLTLIRLRTPTSLIRSPSPPDIFLFLLFPIGVAGTLYGILVKGETVSALAIFLPMIVAFTYLGTVQDITEAEVERLLRALAVVGSLYLLLNALVNVGVIPGLAANQYRNASLIFMALGIAAAVILRRWFLLAGLIALEAFVFTTYPSGTSVLVFLTMLLTFVATAPRPSRARPFLIGVLTAITVTFIILNFNAGVAITSDYFSLVGKNNADSTRLQAWAEGVNRFRDSPLVGSVFSEPGVTTVTRPGGRGQFQIPFHNDYIFFLAGGGIVGIGLLLAWIIATEILVARRYGDLLASGETARPALVRALLVGFNVFFVTCAFNPSLEGMSRSASVFAVYAMMMAALPPSPRRHAL